MYTPYKEWCSTRLQIFGLKGKIQLFSQQITLPIVVFCQVNDLRKLAKTSAKSLKTELHLLYGYTTSLLPLIRACLLLCRAKKDVVLPEYHFVDHRIEILSHDRDYNNVVVYENAVARPSPLPSKAK